MNPETFMKLTLDGWFYTLDFAHGRTRSMPVPLDYIPDHRPMITSDPSDGPAGRQRKAYLAHEDATILEMRDGGARWSDIARALHRSKGSVQERYVSLRSGKEAA